MLNTANTHVGVGAGVGVVVLGPRNVGKSAIINTLLNAEQAKVSLLPGPNRVSTYGNEFITLHEFPATVKAKQLTALGTGITTNQPTPRDKRIALLKNSNYVLYILRPENAIMTVQDRAMINAIIGIRGTVAGLRIIINACDTQNSDTMGELWEFITNQTPPKGVGNSNLKYYKFSTISPNLCDNLELYPPGYTTALTDIRGNSCTGTDTHFYTDNRYPLVLATPDTDSWVPCLTDVNSVVDKLHNYYQLGSDIFITDIKALNGVTIAGVVTAVMDFVTNSGNTDAAINYISQTIITVHNNYFPPAADTCDGELTAALLLALCVKKPEFYRHLKGYLMWYERVYLYAIGVINTLELPESKSLAGSRTTYSKINPVNICCGYTYLMAIEAYRTTVAKALVLRWYQCEKNKQVDPGYHTPIAAEKGLMTALILAESNTQYWLQLMEIGLPNWVRKNLRAIQSRMPVGHEMYGFIHTTSLNFLTPGWHEKFAERCIWGSNKCFTSGIAHTPNCNGVPAHAGDEPPSDTVIKKEKGFLGTLFGR